MYKGGMELSKILNASRKGMELMHREETKEEGYSPGLCILSPGGGAERNGPPILLDATYNNYTITNNYRSREQGEANAALKKENRRLTQELGEARRKYEQTKKLACQAANLVNHIRVEDLDQEAYKELCEFNTKWERVTSKRRANNATEIETDVNKRAKYQ